MLLKNLEFDDPEFIESTWVEYWSRVQRIKQTKKCSITEARKMLHDKIGKFEPVVDPKFEFQNADCYVIGAMLRLTGWRSKRPVSRQVWRLLNEATESPDWFETLQQAMSLDDAYECLSVGRRSDLVSHLTCADRYDLVEKLLDDPIYGNEAEFEIRIHKWSADFHESEEKRIAQFPDQLKALHDIMKQKEPGGYTFLYPYHPNQFHNIPNCLNAMADGFTIFRLEVLDTVGFDRFRLAETKGEESYPGGEFLTAFRLNGIEPGSEFDYSAFKTVLESGVLWGNLRMRAA